MIPKFLVFVYKKLKIFNIKHCFNIKQCFILKSLVLKWHKLTQFGTFKTSCLKYIVFYIKYNFI